MVHHHLLIQVLVQPEGRLVCKHDLAGFSVDCNDSLFEIAKNLLVRFAHQLCVDIEQANLGDHEVACEVIHHQPHSS